MTMQEKRRNCNNFSDAGHVLKLFLLYFCWSRNNDLEELVVTYHCVDKMENIRNLTWTETIHRGTCGWSVNFVESGAGIENLLCVGCTILVSLCVFTHPSASHPSCIQKLADAVIGLFVRLHDTHFQLLMEQLQFTSNVDSKARPVSVYVCSFGKTGKLGDNCKGSCSRTCCLTLFPVSIFPVKLFCHLYTSWLKSGSPNIISGKSNFVEWKTKLQVYMCAERDWWWWKRSEGPDESSLNLSCHNHGQEVKRGESGEIIMAKFFSFRQFHFTLGP